MKPFLPRLVPIAVLTALAGAARATLIDFEDVVPVDDYGFYRTYGSTFESGGFVFSGFSMTSWRPTADLVSGNYTGSTAMFSFDPGSLLTMTRAGGGTFSLGRMELAHAFLGGSEEDVTFVGTKAGGGEVTRTFTLPGGDDGLRTVTFSGFEDLVSVRWNQSPNLHQFDNVRVDEIQPTPGPAAAAPFALLLLRRRRRG